ncbi:hypothetical protein KY290_021714 [Solanum tuberosum]|uniref:Uncharacterized protein n=1 Tax=Solanum tuberosum TaxID=4113 RepID=A0ABQ7V2F2_SOLTU|nr:hypothetical protein KY289_020879 [Solanum tuberosum]KAH0758221.1 hypothetical protein KY290_021714 [Solanum tuberosum]
MKVLFKSSPTLLSSISSPFHTYPGPYHIQQYNNNKNEDQQRTATKQHSTWPNSASPKDPATFFLNVNSSYFKRRQFPSKYTDSSEEQRQYTASYCLLPPVPFRTVVAAAKGNAKLSLQALDGDT